MLVETVKKPLAKHRYIMRNHDNESKLNHDVDRLKNDVSAIKNDVSSLKSDVATLKTDVAVLKNDVSYIKNDLLEIKSTIKAMDTKFDSKFDRLTWIVVLGILIPIVLHFIR